VSATLYDYPDDSYSRVEGKSRLQLENEFMAGGPHQNSRISRMFILADDKQHPLHFVVRRYMYLSRIFALGDSVTWSSQSAGVALIKTGIIEEVVDPGKLPDRDRFEQLYRGPGIGMSRDHESYVVRVPGKTSKGVGKLYWPRRAGLRCATQEN